MSTISCLLSTRDTCLYTIDAKKCHSMLGKKNVGQAIFFSTVSEDSDGEQRNLNSRHYMNFSKR